jgi:hypothetical protein
MDARPGVLIVGTGNLGRMKIPRETVEYLTTWGIHLEVDQTAAACRRYNELAKGKQKVAAALHLTC